MVISTGSKAPHRFRSWDCIECQNTTLFEGCLHLRIIKGSTLSLCSCSAWNFIQARAFYAMVFGGSTEKFVCLSPYLSHTVWERCTAWTFFPQKVHLTVCMCTYGRTIACLCGCWGVYVLGVSLFVGRSVCSCVCALRSGAPHIATADSVTKKSQSS